MTGGNWPHQVALPAYTMHFFCQELSLSSRTHAFCRDAAGMTVFCFAEREHAKKFRDRFGGELIDPATRPEHPRTRVRGSDLCTEQRLRNGRCINCDD